MQSLIDLFEVCEVQDTLAKRMAGSLLRSTIVSAAVCARPASSAQSTKNRARARAMACKANERK